VREAVRRDLVFYDVVVRSDPDHAPVWQLNDLLKRIGLLFEEQTTAYWREKKRKKIFLRQFCLSDQKSCAALLIYCTNADAPDSTFTHLQTDEERTVEKSEGEGRPESVHMLISSVNAGQVHRYVALLEGGQLLHRAIVEHFLNHLLRLVGQASPKEFSCSTPDGHADQHGRLKTYRYHSIIRLQGHLADSFYQDLESGRLTGVALESDGSAKAGFAEGTYVKPQRTTIRLSPQSTWKDKALESLKESLGLAKENKFERVKVAFTSPDAMPHSVELDPVTGNTVGDAFIKRIRIGPFADTKADASKQFDREILAYMVSQFNKLREANKIVVAVNDFSAAPGAQDAALSDK